MALGRSPNYPRIDFKDALEKVKEVYEKQHTYPADKEVLSKNLGYGGINGGSQAMMGALGSYGLLVKEGKEYRVSDDAVSILVLPADSPERAGLIKSLALSPDVFADLDAEYEDKLPQNELIRHFLIKKKFLPKAADEVIRIYRANLELVNGLDSKHNVDSSSDEPSPKRSEAMQQQPTSQRIEGVFQQPPPVFTPTAWSGDDVLSFNISRNGKAQVRFNGQITQEAIKKLIAHLDLSLDTYPTQAEIVQPQNAIWKTADHDQPVTVTGELGMKDGKRFYSIAESSTGISEDELDFNQ